MSNKITPSSTSGSNTSTFTISPSSNGIPIKPLRKMLQRFNDDLGQYINADARFKLGRVLTIMDAAVADPEQRKAIKDLINNEWWGGHTRPTESTMINPHDDLRAICTVLGFELYDPLSSNSVPLANDDEWVVRRYDKVSKED